MTSPLVWENADRAELIHELTGRPVPLKRRPQLSVDDAASVVECLQGMDPRVLGGALGWSVDWDPAERVMFVYPPEEGV